MSKIKKMTQAEKMEHRAGIAALEAKKESDKKAEEEIIQGLVDQLHGMKEDRDKKCAAAKEQLIENLEVTADKYRTATGVMEALRVMRMVNDGAPKDMEIVEEVDHARAIAADMVIEVSNLVDKAEALGWDEMDQLCKDAYKEDFISEGFSALDLCFELMRLDLCRNVGPAAEDMVSFFGRIQEELDSIESKLDKMDKDWSSKYQSQNAGDRA